MHLNTITVNGLSGQYSSKSGLNVSNCSALQSVTMTSSTPLASTTITGCSELTSVSISNTTINESLDLSSNTSLTTLNLNNVSVGADANNNYTLNLSGDTALKNANLSSVTLQNRDNINISNDALDALILPSGFTGTVTETSATVKNKVAVNGTAVTVTLGTGGSLAGALGLLDSSTLSSMTSLTVNGTVDALQLSSYSNLTKIDLSRATVDISGFNGPSSLQALVLPLGTTLTDAQKAAFSSKYSELYYIYSPTNDSGATVADNVFVLKAGGLARAFENESTLRSGIYIKVESDVALNADDINFNALTNKPTAYEYLDLSGANLTVEIAANYDFSKEWSSAYRMILPDGWSADDMALFGKLGGDNKLGKIAAVYSYTGTKLNILGLNNNNYSETALSDGRIVRSGTTAVDFVSGTYNNSNYGVFGQNMLTAANGANSSIKSIGLSTSSGVPNALTFSNINITSLDLSSITIGSAALTTSSCTLLQTINLSGSTVSSVNASGCSNLQAMTLTGTTVSGALNVSNSGITRITVDTRIGGTITATGCSSLTRIYNSGTIGGDVVANGTSDKKLTNLTTFINKGTISGDVNMSYTGLTSFTNNGTVKNINLSHCDASGFTTFAPAGTINGDIDLTDCTNLTSINVADATINNLGTYNSGYSADVNFTRSSQSNISNSVYDNLKYGDSGYNVTKASNGQNSLTFLPSDVTPKMVKAASTSVSGVTEDDCALTVGVTSGETLTSLLQKFYAMKKNIADYTTVTTGSSGNLSTLNICNLTVTGEITATDIATINNLTFNSSTGSGIMWRDATLNLDGATLASGVSLSTTNITNTTVKNIILPRNLTKADVAASNFSSCTNLNAAVSLNAARTSLVGYVKTPGSLRTTLDQVSDIRPNPWQYTCNLEDITLSGSLLASDIATSSVNLDANGNYQNSANSSISSAFENDSKLKTLDIENAKFVDAADANTAKPENMTLGQLGWAGITSLVMSKQMNTIPANFLNNCKQINYLKIPYCYRWIKDGAFYLSGLNHITTTDASGNEIDNGDNTYTLSKNLLEIGTNPGTDVNGFPNVPSIPVFGAYNSGTVSDVYILRSGYEDGLEFTPTKCYRGMFASGMTYGWGGFDGGNIYCREKYKNGAFLFTILHYPDQASLPSSYNNATYYEAMQKSYTDISKEYTKKDQTGALDANGEALKWPTFAELGRSYNQAIRRLVWDDWSDTYGENTPDGNIKGGTINFDVTSYPDGVKLKDDTQPTNITDKTNLTRFALEYVGWHEFVLSKATYVPADAELAVEKEYEQDGWYTFCIPFDMTYSEVVNLLGVPKSTSTTITKIGSSQQENDVLPDIYTLASVTRKPGDTQGIIQLRLSDALQSGTNAHTYPELSSQETPSYVDNGTYTMSNGLASEAIYIRGGYPYLIKPYKLTGTDLGNPGETILKRYAFSMASSSVGRRTGCYLGIGGQFTGEQSNFVIPYANHKMKAALLKSDDSADGYDNYHVYTFIGQYWQQPLPLYSYYLARSTHRWYYYNSYHSKYKWLPYNCIINVGSTQYANNEGLGEEKTVIPVEVAKDEKGHAVFNQTLRLVYGNATDDSFTASARIVRIVFDDDVVELDENGNEVVAIDRLDGVDLLPANYKVYNLKGQYVGNSVDGLAKGMYIVNGKKIVID